MNEEWMRSMDTEVVQSAEPNQKTINE
jgi:hypothetical protein